MYIGQLGDKKSVRSVESYQRYYWRDINLNFRFHIFQHLKCVSLTTKLFDQKESLTLKKNGTFAFN
jgi:hypothetical protein